jgi:hypothetical protein
LFVFKLLIYSQNVHVFKVMPKWLVSKILQERLAKLMATQVWFLQITNVNLFSNIKHSRFWIFFYIKMTNKFVYLNSLKNIYIWSRKYVFNEVRTLLLFFMSKLNCKSKTCLWCLSRRDLGLNLMTATSFPHTTNRPTLTGHPIM